jgi:signal transduction histidine kinase
MLFLINDFMDFAQFEENKIVLNMGQIVNLNQLIKECMDILRFKAEAKSIGFEAEISEELPSDVKIDFNRTK